MEENVDLTDSSTVDEPINFEAGLAFGDDSAEVGTEPDSPEDNDTDIEVQEDDPFTSDDSQEFTPEEQALIDAYASSKSPEVVAEAAPSETLSVGWAAKKVEIEKAWESYDSPSEQALVAIVDQLVARLEALEPKVSAVQSQVAPIMQRGLEAEAQEYFTVLKQSASSLSVEFGDPVTATQLGELIAGGALQAYALMQGKELTQISFNSETVRDIYRMKNLGATPVVPRSDHRALSTRRGGAAESLSDDQLTERQLIARDLAKV